MNKTAIVPDNNHLINLVSHLQSGGIIHIKYSRYSCIACDATLDNPIEILLKINNTAKYEQVLLFENISRIQSYTSEFPDIAWDLLDLSEKPLFIVLDDLRNVSKLIIKQKNDIAFGLTTDISLTKLCSRLRKPLFCIYLFDQNAKGEFSNTSSNELVLNADLPIPSKIKLNKKNQIEIIRS